MDTGRSAVKDRGSPIGRRIEQPYTLPRYQRCGLAAAGLAALRAEHPGF
jgi:hypothetical protein